MNRTQSAPVCVIVAAKDASCTIGRAIRSALDAPQVGEVVVIDDGSRDDTARVAQDCEDGTGRLHVVRFTENRGPASARNSALRISRSPLIAVLDADDFFLKGRFDQLLAGDDWDFAADNILFSDSGDRTLSVPAFMPEPSLISLADFVAGNMIRRGRPRGELGFLKPVMRRSFLERHGLGYDESLRLGEDYDLYARALMRGARFRVVRTCGYGAVVRSGSLSGRHDTADLLRLWGADQALLSDPEMPRPSREVIAAHARQVRARYELRRFLDIKRENGLGAAARHVLTRPAALPAIAGGVLGDKLRDRIGSGRPAKAGQAVPRCLLPGRLAMSD